MPPACGRVAGPEPRRGPERTLQADGNAAINAGPESAEEEGGGAWLEAGQVASSVVRSVRVRSPKGMLAGLLIGAALIRALVWARTFAINNDGPVFLGLAELIGAGEWKTALAHAYHPLYPAAIAVVEPAFRGAGVAAPWESAGAAVSIGAGVDEGGISVAGPEEEEQGEREGQARHPTRIAEGWRRGRRRSACCLPDNRPDPASNRGGSAPEKQQ